MIQTKSLTGQCPHCGSPAVPLAYHSRYPLLDGQMVFVIRCRQCRRTFCDRYGTVFYDLKPPEEKVQRAIQQGLEGLCPEAVARIEGVHPTTVGRWVARSCSQAKAADQEVITGVSTQNVELDELYSFIGYLNGTIRQHGVPLHRKTRSFAKRRMALDTQMQLFKSYYNLCRKHGTLKRKTPAQAAGLSDHCWTLRELLTFNAAITSKIT